MQILLTAFRGTSSELLVKAANYKSLLLPNDKVMDSRLLLQEIGAQSYDYIVSFGQKPNIKDKVYLELTARNAGGEQDTNFEYDRLKRALEANTIPVRISHRAGTSFCNALYWSGLHYLSRSGLRTKMIFLHIPFYENCSEPEAFFERILAAIENFQEEKGKGKQTVDFSTITACGECCAGCEKKIGGLCAGCIEADGYVPEWAGSGRCRVHACTRNHKVSFCGICSEFPCGQLPSMIPWNADIVAHLSGLAKQYREQSEEAGKGEE